MEILKNSNFTLTVEFLGEYDFTSVFMRYSDTFFHLFGEMSEYYVDLGNDSVLLYVFCEDAGTYLVIEISDEEMEEVSNEIKLSLEMVLVMLPMAEDFSFNEAEATLFVSFGDITDFINLVSTMLGVDFTDMIGFLNNAEITFTVSDIGSTELYLPLTFTQAMREGSYEFFSMEIAGVVFDLSDINVIFGDGGLTVELKNTQVQTDKINFALAGLTSAEIDFLNGLGIDTQFELLREYVRRGIQNEFDARVVNGLEVIHPAGVFPYTLVNGVVEIDIDAVFPGVSILATYSAENKTITIVNNDNLITRTFVYLLAE
jgi:hypothetical protein